MLFNMLVHIVTLFIFRWPAAVHGALMIYNGSLPTTLTSACSNALLSNVNCDPLVRNLRPEFFYPPESLKRVCTQNCSTAMTNWMTSVQSACGNQTLVADLDLQAAASFIPGQLDYLLKFTCLQESGNYCGPVAALAATFDDPGVTVFNYLDKPPNGTVRPNKCDACIAARLRFRAGSPYFNGPQIASESSYQSMTSSCSISGKPITSTTIGYYTALPPQPSASVCDGANYTIKAGDNCNSIAKAQGVATAWLLADNNLQAYCANFPTTGTLCITNKCKTVTVGTNATCAGIARSNNITETQFRAWNPSINMACSNLVGMNGTQICVDAPGRKFAPPSNVTIPGTTPTAAAPIPSNTAAGSNKTCGQWYNVQKGDYCNSVCLKYSIALADFLFLNTGVNSNCTNLFAEASYCVKAVGDINTYSGRPGYMPITYNPNATFTGTPFTKRPNATMTKYSRPTPMPLASGTRDDCVHYLNGTQFQLSVNGTSWKSPCELAAYAYGVRLSDLGLWNPGLGDTNSSACVFQKGVRYCGSWYVQKESKLALAPTSTTTTPGSSPTPPGPTHSGQPSNCNKWSVVKDGDNCDTVASAAGISRATFLTYNPAVSSDCSKNFWVGYAYCVGLGNGTTTTTTKASTTTTTPGGTTTSASPTAPAPTHSGQPKDCNKWSVVKDGDNCDTVAQSAGITRATFLSYNPAVSSDCSQNFWVGYAYCVGVASSTVTTTTKPSTTTTTPSGTTTSSSPTPPGPTHSGQPKDCNKWSVVKDGDNCDTVAQSAGITRATFLTYNPAVNSDCSQNFWVGYAYCVGVSTPTSTTRATTTTTTTTTKPPSATPSKPPADKVQSGQPSNCSKWDQAVSGDDCSKLASRNKLTVSQLATLNPALGQDGKDCNTKLWLDYYYCVATS